LLIRAGPASTQSSMITKTFLFAKDFRAYKPNFLRQEKGFHDL